MISIAAQPRTSPDWFPGFTRKYGVDRLVYVEEFSSIIEARARERTLKRWRRAWKIQLIEKDNPDWKDLSGEIWHRVTDTAQHEMLR
jgi:predicted GIY-YIG superfamily endonuclease